MRLLFTSLSSHGHTYPLLPLAVAAAAAGHDVTFATGEDMLPAIRKAGLTGALAGISIRDAFTEARDGVSDAPDSYHGADLVPLISRVLGEDLPRRIATDLAPIIAADRPDLVVYEAGNPGGWLAAKQAGIPGARHGYGRSGVDDGAGSAIRQRIGGVAADMGFNPAEMGRDPFIDICPASAQDAEALNLPHRMPLRPVGWAEPADLPAGLADRDTGRPLIYLTLGTSMGSVGVLSTAIAGLAALDADVLVATGPTVGVAELGDVPGNVRLEAWVPQNDLLPLADLVVHHGGSGTTLGAYATGRPQLILPQGADQFSNAEVVAELGVGVRLLPPQVSAESVTEAAGRLLRDETVRAATARMAAEVAAMPSPAEVAAQLPTLV